MGGSIPVRKTWRPDGHGYHYYEGDGHGHGYVRKAARHSPWDKYYVAVVPGGRHPGSDAFDTLTEAKAFVEKRVG